MNANNLKWTWGVVGATIVAALILTPLIRGSEESEAATTGDYVVHEWGTFTNFSGSDGVQLDFRALAQTDLPPFVMNATGLSAKLFLKSAYVARQRMETPVAYFYTDVPREVEVRVDFPHGLLTEWYPVVKDFGPRPVADPSQLGAPPKTPPLRDSYLDWGKVRLLPQKVFDQVKMRGTDNQPIAAALPTVANGNHYAHARETDSAIVETVDASKGSHFEKFLFYRGIGNFRLPVSLAALGNGHFQLTNEGSDRVGEMFLVQIAGGKVRYARYQGAAADALLHMELPAAESSIDNLGNEMVQALVAAGLYEKEARAMVKTWHASWFGESGTRLLYLVPQRLTDELLPIKIKPAPKELVRILVGRMEVMTPEDRQRLINLVCRWDAKAGDIEPLRDELSTLGRFAEPSLHHIASISTDAVVRRNVEALLASLQKTP